MHVQTLHKVVAFGLINQMRGQVLDQWSACLRDPSTPLRTFHRLLSPLPLNLAPLAEKPPTVHDDPPSCATTSGSESTSFAVVFDASIRRPFCLSSSWFAFSLAR